MLKKLNPQLLNVPQIPIFLSKPISTIGTQCKSKRHIDWLQLLKIQLHINRT